MEKLTPTTKPRFVDHHNGLIDPPPIFVTRTTLRAILNKHGAKVSGLGMSSKPNELMPSNTTMDELPSGTNR
ncbi:hypothetical protein [Pseudomonas syringae]|uniref:hypothetical protein n=1 Tax=Pseudomonas syringae TaxID=317 RepID=UPI000C07B485|nr:hypothetical protein [Pseudomonas syringae]